MTGFFVIVSVIHALFDFMGYDIFELILCGLVFIAESLIFINGGIAFIVSFAIALLVLYGIYFALYSIYCKKEND